MSNFDDFAKFSMPVEKSWIPRIEDNSDNAAAMGVVSGTSLRWGNYVWICFGIITTSIMGLTGTDPMLIKGLPYAPSEGATIHLSSLDGLNLVAGDSLPRGYIDQLTFPNAIAMQFLPNTITIGDLVWPVDKWTDTGTCIGCGFYVTDD